MKGLTNKQIIKRLLPYLERGIEKVKNNQIQFTGSDYYDRPCRYEYFKNPETNKESEIFLVYTDCNDRICIEAVMKLEGKFDHATLYTYFMKETKELFKTSMGAVYGFKKEFRGKGNGYYADVDARGKIIYGEWD